jgi:Domain of unknown function (DUF5666)
MNMKHTATSITRQFARIGFASLAAITLLSACGGGSSSPAAGTTPVTGSTSAQDSTVGIISGFGSVIINGVRYDDSAATVQDDHGTNLAASRLGLGMTVQLKGQSNDDGTGVASGINVFSEIQGPISSLNAAAGTFSLFGNFVTVDNKTVFADTAGLSTLSNGTVVEVFGFRNGNSVTATRIERKSLAAGDVVIKLRGSITGLNTSASTFNLAGLVVSYSSAQVRPSSSSLVEGGFVSVSSTSSPSGTTLSANRVTSQGVRSANFDNNAKAELAGIVTSFTSASQFVVAGVTVNASNAIFVQAISNCTVQ